MNAPAPFASNIIRWPAEAIWQAVAPLLTGFTVELLPEIDSTNTELMRRLRGSAGAEPRPEPLLLVAEQQSAGRGRMGRTWQSRRGASLTFSLSLPLQPADWSGLSLAVGESVAQSLEPLESKGQSGTGRPRLVLKWPNDLWLLTPEGERKLGGILVETASWHGQRHVVIGVGLNIEPVNLADIPEIASENASKTAPESAPARAAVPPGCLQQLSPGLDAPAALLRIVPALVQAVQTFERLGFAPFQAGFAARDVLQGRTLVLSDGLQGVGCGVAGNGALRLQTAQGLREVTSSEVSVRPLASAAQAQDTLPC